MRISFKAWCGFIFLALLGAVLWAKYMYPQFRVLDLACDRQQAIARAEEYLRARGVRPTEFMRACVFESDNEADRFLQKSIGPAAEDVFLARHGYELFSWNIRFFKPLQKEEYYVTVSPSTGRIVSYEHVVDDAVPMPSLSKEEARLKAEDFLKGSPAVDLRMYDFHEEKAKRLDSRTDHVFTWEKKGVRIPWRTDQGLGKLLAGVKITGDRIGAFYTHNVVVPDGFLRFWRKERAHAGVLFACNMIVILALTGMSVYLAFKMRAQAALRHVVKWYVAAACILLAVRILSLGNGFPETLFSYPTSTSLAAYISTYVLNSLILLGFYCLLFVMPALAGESLRRLQHAAQPGLSLAHYIKGSFFTRGVSKMILAGYPIFCITIGLQAALLYLGQSYAGVWKEWGRLSEFSSSYLPLYGVFALSVSASFTEEIIYRLFGISLGIRYLKKPWLAVAAAAFAWGLGHSMYPVFPAWYRVAEVSVIGLMFGFIFLRFGIIPLLVAHYLVDVFWGVMGYLFGHVGAALFFGSVGLLCVPLALAALAYFADKKEAEIEPVLELDRTQQHILEVLIAYTASRKAAGDSEPAVAHKLLAHHWDADVVDLALRKVFGAR